MIRVTTDYYGTMNLEDFFKMCANPTNENMGQLEELESAIRMQNRMLAMLLTSMYASGHTLIVEDALSRFSIGVKKVLPPQTTKKKV